MIINATFWVAVSFFIFFGVLIYLKVPQKINNLLSDQIFKIQKELGEAEKLKIEAKNLLSNYENKIDKSKKETQEIINLAKKDSEKIIRMKENALNDIKNISVKISMEAVEHLIKNSIDKNKLEKLYTKSLDQAKTALKHIKT